jgi:hypothetical protein
MEIGGLMAYVFKAALGNPDIMVALLSWSVLFTLVMVTIQLYHDFRS